MAVTPPFVAPADADAVTAALRTQLAGLPARSPFYADLFAEHGIGPEDFEELADIARFPFTEKQMLREQPGRGPPARPARRGRHDRGDPASTRPPAPPEPRAGWG